MPKSEDKKKSTASRVVLNKKHLTQIARNSLFNGFIALDDLVLVMAEDASYSDILYGLWRGFQCNLRSPVEDFDVESERESVEVYSDGKGAGRTRLWFDLLHRWAGLGVQGVRSGLADIRLLPIYKVDASTGELRKPKYLGYEVGVDYVRLDDLKGYLDDLKLPSPSRLFPSLAPGEFISPDNIFRKDGDGWHICFAGNGFHLKNYTGLKYIYLLLDSPGNPIYAYDLATIKINPSAIPATDGSEETRKIINKMARGRLNPEEEEEEALQEGKDEKPQESSGKYRAKKRKAKTGKTLLSKENLTVSSSIDRDYQNRNDHKLILQRIYQIEGQLRECHNPEVELELREEKELLEKELNRFAIPISSKSDEKSRKSVSGAIRRAYTKIGEHNSELKTYLERHIKLGHPIVYHPDSSNPITWIFE